MNSHNDHLLLKLPFVVNHLTILCDTSPPASAPSQVLDTPTGSGKSLVAVAALFQALGVVGEQISAQLGRVGWGLAIGHIRIYIDLK